MEQERYHQSNPFANFLWRSVDWGMYNVIIHMQSSWLYVFSRGRGLGTNRCSSIICKGVTPPEIWSKSPPPASLPPPPPPPPRLRPLCLVGVCRASFSNLTHDYIYHFYLVLQPISIPKCQKLAIIGSNANILIPKCRKIGENVDTPK